MKKKNNLEKLFNIIMKDDFFQSKDKTYNLLEKEIKIWKQLKIKMNEISENNYIISLYFRGMGRVVDTEYKDVSIKEIINLLKDNSKTRKLYIEQPEWKPLAHHITWKNIPI